MIYIRGHARDYDHWRQMGCDGWSFADVLPYFKRAETNENGGDDFHGGDGPLHVSNGSSSNPLFRAFVQAGAEAGHPLTNDFNGKAQEGFGPYQLTIRNGRRWSAAAAYLHAMRWTGPTSRSNPTRMSRAFCSKARAPSASNMRRRKRRCQARAIREVILSGGAVNTPQVLLLSGIGDPEILKRFDHSRCCGPQRRRPQSAGSSRLLDPV